MPDSTRSVDDADSLSSTRDTAPNSHEVDTNAADRLTTLDSRLAALERAVTDGETDLDRLADPASRDARLDELESRAAEIETRLDELDAAVQSLRGYVGAIRAVNREVERRADAALSAVDRLDDTERVADLELPDGTGTLPDGATATGDRHSTETGDEPPSDTDTAGKSDTEPVWESDTDTAGESDTDTAGESDTDTAGNLAGRVRDLL